MLSKLFRRKVFKGILGFNGAHMLISAVMSHFYSFYEKGLH